MRDDVLPHPGAAPARTRPVRVLHPITRMAVGGAQENTLLTAATLRRDYEGYDAEILCTPYEGPEGSLLPEVRRRGVPLRLLPSMVHPVHPLRDLRALRDFTRLLAPHGEPVYDIVHTHGSKAGILGRFAARRAGVPVIVHTVHGWGFHDHTPAWQRRVFVELERRAAAFTDVLIAVTARDIDKGLAEGIGRPDQYVVVRSGVEMDRFGHPNVPAATVRAELGIPPGAPVAGSVTRLIPQKAPLDLVDAFAAVARRRPDAWFLVVGDGPLRPETEARLRGHGILERTVITGWRRDVPELLPVMDVFLLSSLWEGLPRVIPQAMASGVVPVCTRVDGSAEAVEHGVNGYLAEPGDPAALGSLAADLLDDDAARRRMAGEGLRRAPEYSAEAMVRALHDLYERLLAERGR